VDENVVDAAHAAQSMRVAPLTFSSSGVTGPALVDRLFIVPGNARPRWALLTSSGSLLPGLPYTVTLSPGIRRAAHSLTNLGLARVFSVPGADAEARADRDAGDKIMIAGTRATSTSTAGATTSSAPSHTKILSKRLSGSRRYTWLGSRSFPVSERAANYSREFVSLSRISGLKSQ
jgi:hypothetical protein